MGGAGPSERAAEETRPRGDACLLCGAPRSRWFSRAGRRVDRCSRCGLILVPDGLAVDPSGASIYESETSIFEVDGNEGYYLDHETNLDNCRLKLAWVCADLRPGARLLDAGANFGHFLKVAQDDYDAEGFDVSPRAVRWSQEHFGVRNRVTSVYDVDVPATPYDAVTLWDVVEHLADPLPALRRLRGVLRPSGWLFLSTPDAGSLAARLMGRRWHYLDPVQHLTVFSRRNLEAALARCGFRVQRWGRLGHRYRLGYVLDRLSYLHQEGWGRAGVTAARAFLGPLRERSISVNLGDVAILSARRLEEGEP
jgi:2-polyprenyl-3-methyl-5-hydroxy-6-metoxy-1,4-benzoquinol methylase